MPETAEHHGYLFQIDLGANGGLVQAKEAQELINWIQREESFWSWMSAAPQRGSHFDVVQGAVNYLSPALGQAQNLLQYTETNMGQQRMEATERITQHLTAAYQTLKLPHSSTPQGKRVEQLRTVNPNAAIAMVYAIISTSSEQIAGLSADTWYGLILGISERYDLQSILPTNVNSHIEALEAQRVKSDRMLGEDRAAVDAITRDCENLKGTVKSVQEDQKMVFDTLLAEHTERLVAQHTEHAEKMTRIEETFKEKMKLRAPVNYWDTRMSGHSKMAGRWMWASFVSIIATPLVLAGVAYSLMADTPADKPPEVWRLAALTVATVFAVWFVRLVVRMYLSHVHLRADASERVTMVETYLSLMEEGKIPDSEDRKLVLAPLFRPASDGIRKDEGVPHPLIDILTRPKS